jgi:hypothetical protein
MCSKNLINVIYVVKDLVGMVTYKHTLEHIQVINLINVLYVIEDLVSINLCKPIYHIYKVHHLYVF